MYLLPFQSQYRDHDFSLISNAVKDYYPGDTAERLTSKTFSLSPGFARLRKIANEEFLNEKGYREKWGKLTSHLKKILKKPVEGYPDLLLPGGFVGGVVVSEDKQPDFIRQKTLRFYISLIGPFFSIHGVDSSTAILSVESRLKDFDKGNFAATHAITVSPAFEYQEIFNALENELRAYFPGYLFVPHTIGMSTIKNISIADDARDPRSIDTVYEALFGRTAVYECRTRGDIRHGFDDWIKPLSKEEEALLDLISQHIINAPADTTVHKVWKLAETKRLDTFRMTGNLMFGVDPFDVVDLTDRSNVIIISKKRGAPSSGDYNIKDNVIEINSNLFLRITDLSEDTLTLNVILKIEDKNVSLNGEVMELKFTQMKNLE